MRLTSAHTVRVNNSGSGLLVYGAHQRTYCAIQELLFRFFGRVTLVREFLAGIESEYFLPSTPQSGHRFLRAPRQTSAHRHPAQSKTQRSHRRRFLGRVRHIGRHDLFSLATVLSLLPAISLLFRLMFLVQFAFRSRGARSLRPHTTSIKLSKLMIPLIFVLLLYHSGTSYYRRPKQRGFV